MDTKTISKILKALAKDYHNWEEPIITQLVKKKRDPFKVLIGTIISQRTKDEVTGQAAARLFKEADTPRKMVKLTPTRISKLIYPAGFYKTKGKAIINVCRTLIKEYKGDVPDTIEELVKLKGVGRKTANLVLTLGYAKLGICVDTHVHRISNRFGYVKTKTPDDTEYALRKKLPEKWWILYNDLLVTHGQNVCRPISPKCSECVAEKWCGKKGVKVKKNA